MAIKLKLPFSLQSIPWKWLVLGITLVGCGFMGQQLYTHGLDHPISDATIRSQQLRLSTDALEQVTSSLEKYHTTPPATPNLSTDPFALEKTTNTPTP